MSLAGPPPVSTSLLRRLTEDLQAERRAEAPLPPGPMDLNLARAHQFARDALPVLLECYREYGPVFAVRVLHTPVVFMLGPAANHFMTVSHAHLFRWRDGHMADLIPLLGDGMLTIDGPFHRSARRIALPAFHRERIAEATELMLDETEQALSPWRTGARVDLYDFTRELALRIALRALFGLDPDRTRSSVDPAAEFEQALSFYGRDYFLQMLRGPGSPWWRMLRARGRLDGLLYAEIARRRTQGERGQDILSLLLDAQDEDGGRLSDQHVRDQMMTLLFAGHDTTTSTVAFLFYELARHPAALAAVLHEQDEVLGGRRPSPAELAGALPELDMAVDETLRLYPPAWVGPRRAAETFEFGGHRIARGLPVNYCSWASHHLPDVWPEPEAFVPSRFTPEARAALPKGAYIPFGGGSRTCIGMRFGLTEVKVIATAILQRFRLELAPAHRLALSQVPTLSPRGGMPMTVRERALPPELAGPTPLPAYS